MLYILWVLVNVQWHSSTFTVSLKVFSLLWTSSCSTSWLLATTSLFVSTVLSFSEFHIVGITHPVAFSDQLLLLSIHVSSTSFHGLKVHFFLALNKYPTVWRCQSLFIHSATEGHMIAFKFCQLWIKLLETPVRGYWHEPKFSTPLHKYQSALLLEHTVCLVF